MQFEIINEKEMLEDIQKLVRIPSVLALDSIKENAPFGENIRNCFDTFKEIASRMGFDVEDDQGYAMSASFGEGEEYVGVLGHLDVVEAGDVALWDTPPYEMSIKNRVMYGRGVNDDKGPLIAALYAAKRIKDQNLPLRYPIRIIAGGAEETTWECMDHYFQTHRQPMVGFSPDGNFPIVNGEKGILQVAFQFPCTQDMNIVSSERLNYVCDKLHVQDRRNNKEYTFHGTRSLSRNPQRGDNAIFTFVKDEVCNHLSGSLKNCVDMLKEQFCDDFYGKKSGLFVEDDAMGSTSVCVMSLTCDETIFEVCLDIRYVKSITEKDVLLRLEQIALQYYAKLTVIKAKRLLFVDEDSALIQGLKKAYYRVMQEEAEVLTKGGASYARVLDHGVAFGATFPNEDPKPHMPNECMPIDSLLKACEIYYEALYELCVDTSKLK